LQKEYYTVSSNAVVEIVEKKSRFIAAVKHITEEDEAICFINELKTKHWDASHNVYSYYLGGNNNIQRFSDDGEPSGTAGMPVLEVIKRTGVQDLVVVVTRYFGGTLLGAAGLIRAYSKCATLGIETAGIIKKQLCTIISILAEYTLFGKLQNFLMGNGYTIKEVTYNQDVEIKVYVKIDDVEFFTESIIEITNARAILEFGDNTYISFRTDDSNVPK
jgi:uncharacterized YigZ family protein